MSVLTQALVLMVVGLSVRSLFAQVLVLVVLM